MQEDHYGKNFLCRATICTAKGLICTVKALPCVAAWQRPDDKAIDGKEALPCASSMLHGKGLCRATPHGKGRFFAVC
jgi:hypothetical protein